MLNGKIDLRSDLVTQPTEEMRKVMHDAPTGVFSEVTEDPTVIELEQLAAKILGKEAGLFVISGTGANLIAAMTHTNRGNAVLLAEDHHHYGREAGSIALVGGVMPKVMSSTRGVIDAEHADEALSTAAWFEPRIGLIWMENTHNDLGGIAIAPEEAEELFNVAERHNVPVHLDGARIFNAATALNVDVSCLAERANSVMFCLNKGLSSPLGSVLLGSSDFIGKARVVRKMTGGSMRQAGMLAAAGIISLQVMTHRLHEDHTTAQMLAEKLSELDDLRVVRPETNIVWSYVDSSISAKRLASELAKRNVLVLPRGERAVRMVTHRHVTPEDVAQTAAMVAEALSGMVRR